MTQTSHFTTESNVRAAGAAAKPMVGHWRLERFLGSGRWTRVFQARPTSCLDDWPCDYAIKLPRPEYVDDPHALEMMRREAQAGQCVSHPNLVSVLSSRVDSPPIYLVTAFLPGATASSLLPRAIDTEEDELAGLPIPLALWIVRQSAEALCAMHEAGWRHGDVKSDNVMVSPDGHATLIDLGMSAPINERCDGQIALRGSLGYAAPEFFTAARTHDGQSDIYSLGVMLYELLTGKLPFEIADQCELAVAHLQNPPPDPRRYNPALPTRMARFLRRMLSKEPLRRPTAEDVVNVLFELEIETFDQWE